ncbi:MAG: DinB family protein [Acidimicrobiales bacterium]
MSDVDAPCEVCGFVRRDVGGDVSARVRAAVDGLVRVLRDNADVATRRPSPERWSALEYGAHVRDVLISLRERTLTASIEDRPTGQPIHRDERVDLGFYALDTVPDVARELADAASLLLRTFDALPEGFARRRLLYSPVTPVEVTVAWLGTQAVHESEHHLLDATTNLTLLRAQ